MNSSSWRKDDLVGIEQRLTIEKISRNKEIEKELKNHRESGANMHF